MKTLKLAVIALFAFASFSTVNAQDENNPWLASAGLNIIDFYGNDTGIGDNIKDLLGNGDWNAFPSLRVAASKYIDKGFSVGLGFGYADITNGLGSNETYISLDATGIYDLNMLFGETGWFDPFVYAGASFVSVNASGLALNGGVGFHAWVNDQLAITFSNGTKIGLGDVKTHFQTSIGASYRVGAKDTDGDGVSDKMDACPEVAGLAEFNGCPDADGDGIKDADDACPNTAGLASLNGCPDADADGIADKNDMCPNAKGTKANKGCPDTDGDGIVDKDDKCPNVAGPVANYGCPYKDTDNDGILDKDDKCPNEAGVASENGCPEPIMTKEAQSEIDEYAKTILFNSGRTTFKAGVTAKLDALVQVMNKYPKAMFQIQGHTDSQGSASLNQRVSQKRAMAVRDYLVKKGIATSRLDAVGLGEGQPIATNRTAAGRAKNRRVVIKTTNAPE